MKKLLLIVTLISCFVLGQTDSERKHSNELARKFNSQYQQDLTRFKNLKILNRTTITKEELETFAGFIGDMPVFYSNFIDGIAAASSVPQARTATINGQTLNLSGAGQTVHMWDLNVMGINGMPGIQHNDFENRVTIAPNQTATIGAHAVIVAGIMVGAGIVNNTKVGMAPKANIVSYDIINDTQNTHFIEMLDPNIKVSNHSYGIYNGWTLSGGVYFFNGNYSVNPIQSNHAGKYYENSRQYDDIVIANPNHLMIKSVGNNYNTEPTGTTPKKKYNGTAWVDFAANDIIPSKNCANGYDCLTSDGASKNILIVQSVNKILDATNKPIGYTRPSDVVHTKFIGSGGMVGPRDDGAIKPDISAVGKDIISTTSSTVTAYSNPIWGTSFSSPAVSGIALLLHELWAQKGLGIMRSDVARGILTHTADEAGIAPGPDPIFGWGLVDALKAVTIIMNRGTTSSIETRTLNNTGTYQQTITADGNIPLKVSLVWIDPTDDSIVDNTTTNNVRTSKIINDLDLVVEKVSDGTQTFPWKLDPENPGNPATKGINNVDNIEQVLIDSPGLKTDYRINITHKGTLKSGLPQNYALIVSGIWDPLSVENQNKPLTEQINISPNPAKDFLVVKIPQDIKNTGLEIYDLSGKLIKKIIPLNFETGIIDIYDLIQGTYIIKIQTNQGTVSKLFIKK